MILTNQGYENPNLKSLELVTAPVGLVASVSELKNALRIDASVTTDDALITLCITSATSILEKTFGLALLSQTWKLWLDQWPAKKDFLPPYSYQTAAFVLSEVKTLEPAISLAMHPVTAISSIKVYDSEGTPATVDASGYTLDKSQKPSRAILTSNISWPTSTIRAAKAIEIEFVAGFATLPDELKMGVISFAMSIYQSRGCSNAIPAGVYTLFQPYASARI